jgi:hypothetical protein
MNRGCAPVFHMRLPPSSQLKARLTSPALPSRKVASRKFPVSENPVFRSWQTTPGRVSCGGYLQKNSMTCDVVIVFPIPKRVLARKAGLYWRW